MVIARQQQWLRGNYLILATDQREISWWEWPYVYVYCKHKATSINENETKNMTSVLMKMVDKFFSPFVDDESAIKGKWLMNGV